MPTLLHAATGFALGRLHSRTPSWRQSLGFAVLACVPDADLVLHFAGVPYAAGMGHRGAAHSLLAAACVGVLGAALARRRQPLWTGIIVFLAVASHGLLDMLTHGGHGVGLLWPVDLTRYSLPWQPIPAAPMGKAFFGPRGLAVLEAELPASFLLFLLAAMPRVGLGSPAIRDTQAP